MCWIMQEVIVCVRHYSGSGIACRVRQTVRTMFSLQTHLNLPMCLRIYWPNSSDNNADHITMNVVASGALYFTCFHYLSSCYTVKCLFLWESKSIHSPGKCVDVYAPCSD